MTLRKCGMCGAGMKWQRVTAPLPLLEVVYWCAVCDRAAKKRRPAA